MLSVMENKTLRHPLNNQMKRGTLIRTGTVGDGSCFFHSILTGLSATYRKSDVSVKKKYIKRFRKKISNTFDMKDWHKFNGMELLVQNMIYSDIKEAFTNKLRRRPIDITIRCVISFATLDRDILPRAFDLLSKKYKSDDIDNNHYIEDLKKYILLYVTKFISDTEPESDTEENRDRETLSKPCVPKRWGACIEDRDELLRELEEMMDTILRASEKKIFEKFKESVERVSSWVDNDILIKHVSNMFKINILILNARTEEPYKMAITYRAEWPYIVLYYIPGIHFEGMGVYDDDTKQISRKYKENDEIVRWFLNKLN